MMLRSTLARVQSWWVAGTAIMIVAAVTRTDDQFIQFMQLLIITMCGLVGGVGVARIEQRLRPNGGFKMHVFSALTAGFVSSFIAWRLCLWYQRTFSSLEQQQLLEVQVSLAI